MPRKSPNINCQCYRNGNCLHHSAPRRWFGKPECVLLDAPKDPRTKEGCALQYEYPRPDAPLRPPPARVIREGVSYDKGFEDGREEGRMNAEDAFIEAANEIAARRKPQDD